MRVFAFLLLSLSTATSFATEKFNHITCEYQQSGAAWEFMAVNYNRDAKVLSPGQSMMIVSAWTSTRAKNTGYCLALRGTSQPSTIETVLNVFEGNEIFGIDEETCEPSGSNISIVKKETRISVRGGIVDMSVDNWWDQGEPKLLLKHYIPYENENDMVTEIAAEKCAHIKPNVHPLRI